MGDDDRAWARVLSPKLTLLVANPLKAPPQSGPTADYEAALIYGKNRQWLARHELRAKGPGAAQAEAERWLVTLATLLGAKI